MTKELLKCSSYVHFSDLFCYYLYSYKLFSLITLPYELIIASRYLTIIGISNR